MRFQRPKLRLPRMTVENAGGVCFALGGGVIAGVLIFVLWMAIAH